MSLSEFMKPSEIKSEIIDNYQLGLASFVWGHPGIGKSDVINQVVETMGIGLVDIRVAGKDPVDMSGLPSIKDGMAVWNVPAMLPQVARDGEQGVLFLDELTSALPAMQTVAYQLVLEGKCGDYTLPPGWQVIAAGNPTSSRAVSIRQSTALAGRFGHYDMEVDHAEWLDWGRTKPINDDLLAFIKYKPDLLNDVDFDANPRERPCPRTWEFVNRHFPVMTEANCFHKVAAFVGKGAATEFNAFMQIVAGLPTIESILQNPTTAIVTEDPATVHATIAMLFKHVTPANFGTLMKYVMRLPEEFQAYFTLDVIKRDDSMAATPEFLTWAQANATRLM